MTDMYCDIGQIKTRMLILPADTSYDDALNEAANEASRMVDLFLKPYIDVPLNDADDQIAAITADFGASLFKRRMIPEEMKIRGALQPDMNNEIDASGYFAQAIRKLELYIKSYYTLAQEAVNEATVDNVTVYTTHNPDIFLALFEKGLITGKEARDFINKPVNIVTKKIDELERTTTETKTIISTKNDTVSEYHTKRQKKFAFIGSDQNGGYEEQDWTEDE
jgi:hypothetical protein